MSNRSYTKVLMCLVLGVACNSAFAARILNKDEFLNLFMASFTYMATIKACELSSLYSVADDTVNRVIKYGYVYGLHDEQTERIAQNVRFYTMKSIDAYKRSPNISCSDAASNMRTLANSAQKFN